MLDRALKDWVFVEKHNEVADMSRNVGESLLTVASMRNTYANKHVDIYPENKGVKQSAPKRVKVFDLWLTNEHRQIVHDYRYSPSDKRILDGEDVGDNHGLRYYNLYQRPPWVKTSHDSLVHYFVDHFKYLFGDEWEYAINWFAQIVQEPSKRYRCALYSICTFTGTGRGWLVRVANHLFGNNVTTVPSLEDMFKVGSKNGWLYNSVLVTVNEMSTNSDDKYVILDKLKTMLSDDMQSIDLKYGNQTFNTQVYTRLFGQSNKTTDLFIDEYDSRLLVSINDKAPRSPDYYKKLYSLIDDDVRTEFMNQIYTYLMGVKINYEWLQEAPMTKSKERVIRSCKTPTAAAFFDLKLLVGDKFFLSEHVDDFVRSKVVGDTMTNVKHNDVSMKHLSVMKANQIATHKTFKFKGRNINVCSFKYRPVDSLRDVYAEIKETDKLLNLEK